MKTKIKVKELVHGISPEIIKKGEWIDLKLPYSYHLDAPKASSLREKKRIVSFDSHILKLGIAIKLPKEFEALVVPRSSTFSKFNIIQTNSVGIIDSSYCGEDDQWGFPVIAFSETTIPAGTRIGQFRIQPSQKASFWVKLKWLFSNGIKLIKVDKLSDNNRGGFGSTGD